MANYREILTKAIIAKGSKTIEDEREIEVKENISRALGCWIINHKSDLRRDLNKVFITGSYDVFVWFGYDDDTNCRLEKMTYEFNDEINYSFSDEIVDLDERNEFKKYVSKQPTCVDLKFNDNKLMFKVLRSYAVDIIGESKFTIKVNETPVKEIDGLNNINTNYIIEKK